MKRSVPLAIVLVTGIIYFFVPFMTNRFTMDFLYQTILVDWMKIMGVFAIVMSITSLVRRNVYKIQRKVGDYQYSWVELIGMAFMITVSIFLPQTPLGKNMLLGGIREGSVYDWVFSNIQVPMQATMFSLLAFYIASAAYRSFRARNAEATLLLITAGIVMIGRVPLGEDIYNFMKGLNGDASFRWSEIFNFQGITQFILDIPNAATKRAIGFGVVMGMIATSLKIMFGIEKSWLGGTE